MEQILSAYTASISELKKNPTALLKGANGEPIAILNHNRPTAYLLSADLYEMLLERLENLELAQLVWERQAEKALAVEVTLDEL